MSQFDLAAAVRGTVCVAEDAAPEISSERTIETITREILDLKARAGDAIIQIGERLLEAKAQLPHGAWLPWLAEEVEFSERTAQEFMRIAREWSNPRALADLGRAKVLKILTLPPAEREAFLEEHDVADMTSRELEQAIRDRDAAKREAEQAALDLEDARSKIRQLEQRPREVFRDEEAIAEAEAAAKKAAEKEWRDKLEIAEAQLRSAQVRLDVAVKDRIAAQETAAAQAGTGDDIALAAFDLLLATAQENANKLNGLLLKVRWRGDAALAGKFEQALLALAEKIRRYVE